MEITEELLKSHIDYIVDIMENVEIGKCTIVTGFNGSGKSLIRKQMPYKIQKIDKNAKVKQMSMQLRTESKSEFGALSSLMHDLSWIPTSHSTFHLIEQVLNTQLKEDKTVKTDYIILDEPEIGMSRESQLGVALYLKDKMPLILEKTYGIMLITHSEEIVKALKECSNFVNINMKHTKISADEWLSRDVVSTDFNELEEWSSKLFSYVQKVAGKD